jgi:prophage maintenance system killer protein
VSEIIIYEDADGQSAVQVRLDGETVWLTQKQMSELFETTLENIIMHLKNIFTDAELVESATTKDFLVVQTEGKRQVTRTIKHYNLDAIISVGYRVNSKRGVRFRQWATNVLRRHILQGYSLNQSRLAELGITEAQQALELLSRTLHANALVNDTGKEVLALIAGYAKTWRLLLQYDEQTIPLPPGCRPAQGVLSYEKARIAIDRLKADLISRSEATPLFGNARGEALDGILGSIEQTMFGEPLYKSREEKAAHLLYFVIKDHPFSDGNKRIGSFLFLLYMEQEGMTSRMNETALTALALLIAESAPTNKDLLIRLTINLLTTD